MSEFASLVARAVTPAMNREERERIYDVVRRAVIQLQEREGLERGDPRRDLQRHLVEETIRDIESDIVRFLALEKMRIAQEAQDAENATHAGRPR